MTTQEALIAVADAACDLRDWDWENDPSAPMEALDKSVDALRRCSREEQYLGDNHDSKTCSRCGHTFPEKDFPRTTCRGKLLVRSWCSVCLSAYYRNKKREQRSRVTR